jgi:hypothetical protein
VVNELNSRAVVVVVLLGAGVAVASCSLILGGDKNFVDLDSTASSSAESASSGGGGTDKTTSGTGGSGAGGTTAQSSGSGGCGAGQGGCGGAGSSSVASSSAASSSASSSSVASSSAASSSASSGTGGAAPCGAGGLDELTDTFTGNMLDTLKWGQYTDGMGSTVAQSNNQIAVFDTGVAGANAGIYSQGGYSLKGCSASIKAPDAPKINGMSAFFLLSVKTNVADELSFVQSGIYLNMEIHDQGGLKAANQIMFTKGVQVYWRFREAPDSGGTIYWETSATGATWTQQFSYPTANLGFSITKLEANIGSSTSGAAATTIHFDNFNVVP